MLSCARLCTDGYNLSGTLYKSRFYSPTDFAKLWSTKCFLMTVSTNIKQKMFLISHHSKAILAHIMRLTQPYATPMAVALNGAHGGPPPPSPKSSQAYVGSKIVNVHRFVGSWTTVSTSRCRRATWTVTPWRSHWLYSTDHDTINFILSRFLQEQ